MRERMQMVGSNVGQKVWSMANALRDDGVGSSAYLEQVTYLLFLKMADEYSKPPYSRTIGVPADCCWDTLRTKSGEELFAQYDHVLKTLASQQGTLRQIYSGAQNKISNPSQLAKIISMIDGENWSAMSSDVKGDIYEDLLEKIAAATKSGAGQYFTPRALINTIVKCVQPKPGKTIADPCCGSGGFLLAAKAYIENEYATELNKDQKRFLKYNTFKGWEIVQETYRLCLMNLFLHNIGDFEGIPPVVRADSLLADPGDRFDYILTNPPFGMKSSMRFTNKRGEQEREDFTYNRQDFWTTSSNKQINFIQHIHTLLKVDGTAAVVIPDSVLSNEGDNEIIRRKLLETTDLHTILRLPSGVFYAQGISANVIFFDNKPASSAPQTNEIWIYDYRTNVHHTLKKKPLKESDLDDFVKCYCPGKRHLRRETYSLENPNGRWRKYSYQEIISRDGAELDKEGVEQKCIADDRTLSELILSIKERSVAISTAIHNLEKLIEGVDDQ
ncbi:MAG: type I restriction-modification system subunit M [Candidatus Methanoplasma sp.]|nr:type I restriction-modification system subunit M [Candidatus Methanoplasma sp.]